MPAKPTEGKIIIICNHVDDGRVTAQRQRFGPPAL